jgi:hypothetical protein
MQVDIPFVKQRSIALIRNTTKSIGHVLEGVTSEEASTLRDGPDGWSVTEIVCHLRDYSVIFFDRALLIHEGKNPVIVPYDQNQLAVERKYNEEDVHVVYPAMVPYFERLALFFEGVGDDEWDRAGQHPEQGNFTLTKAMIQVGTHNAVHLEQLTRVLAQRTAK